MQFKILSKIGMILGFVLLGLYLVFLLLPFVLNFSIDKYMPKLAGEINKVTGLNIGLEEVRLVTTPKLTAGLKIKKFQLYTPLKEPIVDADNFEVKMSLLPLIAKNIRIDVIKLNNADITLLFKNGDLDFLKYLPQQDDVVETNKENQTQPVKLPFGLKLSNHMPDVHIGRYSVLITDGTDKYVIKGDKTDITDFIFNKNIKIKASAKAVLKDKEQFSCNFNIFNKVMPDIDINDLVFNTNVNEEEKQTEDIKFDIISILKGLYDYKMTAALNADLKIDKESLDGNVILDKVSIIDLPNSNAEFLFKGNLITLNTNLYTALNEVSKLNGQIKTGKKPYADLNFNSEAELYNVLNIIRKIATVFNINDLQTLSANGKINANFNIKSDLKKVQSSGFLKIPNANMYYGAYKIGIDNIQSDILLDNNNVNIKNISFSVLGQPLKICGTVSNDATSDVHITADKLNLKGLLVALGQASLLKENPISSGTVSMDTVIKGKLDKISPLIKLNLSNVDLKNIPLDIRLVAPSTNVDIKSDGVTFTGNAVSSSIKLINPALTVSIPNLKANILPHNIEITQTPVMIEKIKTNVSGNITNYLTEKIGLDFVSTGDIKSTLKGDINIAKQTLALTYATTELSNIIIPMFDKSKLSFKGKINITGNMLNPIISGTAAVPDISIPEIPVTMKDMDIKLNGTILHGSGSLKEFASGGIKAESLTSDFELRGNDFYLNNLKGSSFGGKVNGNIVYNLTNAKTKLNFKGNGLDAEKAIEGAAGIRNALSGTLGFDTNLSLTVLEYNAMMKSLKGNLAFNIKNGAFGTIGRFDGFLGASNITENYFLKNTVNALSNAAGLATTAQFDTLEGNLSFTDGWTNLNPVKSAGKSLCYYITGKYNLVNGTTNVNILGRLDAVMVSKLGALGTLNMSNILGEKAASVLKIITTNPQTENTELIPALTNGSTNYQDFKVSFNGGVESKSSIKSFKWLKNADMTDLKQQTVKDVIDNVKDAYKTDIQTTKDEFNKAVQEKKNEINNMKEQINTTKDDFKNLWNSIKNTGKTENDASVTETQIQNDANTALPAGSKTINNEKLDSSVSTQNENTTSFETDAINN